MILPAHIVEVAEAAEASLDDALRGANQVVVLLKQGEIPDETPCQFKKLRLLGRWTTRQRLLESIKEGRPA
jgi:hypothetical protein